MNKIKNQYFVVFEDESPADILNTTSPFSTLEESIEYANKIRVINKSYQIIPLACVYAPEFKRNSYQLWEEIL